MHSFDKARFGRLRKSVTRSATTLAARFQEMLEMGLDIYRSDNNAEYLTQCIVVAQNAKMLPANKIKDYIKQHANVKWVSTKKEGKTVARFKMDGDAPQVVVPSISWQDTAKQDVVHADLDYKAQIKSLTARLTKGVTEGRIKDGDQAGAEAALTELRKLTAL